jgi:hypothetical protein
MDNKKIKNALERVYGVLKFSPTETKETVNNIAELQQLAVAAELIGNLTESEKMSLGNDFMIKSEDEKIKIISQIFQGHGSNEDFLARAQAAAKKVLDDHIAYLKTRGDEAQKAEVAKIMAEVG